MRKWKGDCGTKSRIHTGEHGIEFVFSIASRDLLPWSFPFPSIRVIECLVFDKYLHAVTPDQTAYFLLLAKVEVSSC